jgi:hypothetical protein
MQRREKDKSANLARMEQKAKTFMRSCVGKFADERGKVHYVRLAEATCDELHVKYRSPQYYYWAFDIAAEYQKTQPTPMVASIYNLNIEYKIITTVYSPKLKQDFSQTNRYLTFSIKNQWLDVEVNGAPLVENESTKHHEHYVRVNVGDTIAVRVYEADNTAEPCGTLTGTVTATKLAFSASKDVRPDYSAKNSVVREHKRPTWA